MPPTQSNTSPEYCPQYGRAGRADSSAVGGLERGGRARARWAKRGSEASSSDPGKVAPRATATGCLPPGTHWSNDPLRYRRPHRHPPRPGRGDDRGRALTRRPDPPAIAGPRDPLRRRAHRATPAGGGESDTRPHHHDAHPPAGRPGLTGDSVEGCRTTRLAGHRERGIRRGHPAAADAFVTLDVELARAVAGIVTVASYEALLQEA
jgi:hypothetical protein